MRAFRPVRRLSRITTPIVSAAIAIAALSFAAARLDAAAQATGRPSAPGPAPKPAPAPAPRVLRVGPGERFTSPSQAAKEARDGDTVEIQAGTYERDASAWTQNNLTLRGVGGRPHLKAGGAAAEGKAIWVIKGKKVTVEDIEFSGAEVSDGNGAGIRGEGPDLTIRRCYFHDNQDGILTGQTDGSIVIESSEFSNNGTGDGQTHNIYIGAAKSFTLRNSYSHHARTGHNVKSRAAENFILYNRILDEAAGTASFEVDISNGGLAYLIGNVIEKGPKAETSVLTSYGAEGMPYPTNQLYVVNNTFVNDRPEGCLFVLLKQSPSVAKIVNNIFAGGGEVVRGTADSRNNLTKGNPRFVNPKSYDYRLMPSSPAIDAGVDPGSAGSFSLVPAFQPVPGAAPAPRPAVRALDLGAFEFEGDR